MDIIDTFADKSTIHGVNDLVKSKSVANRIFWALVMIGAACCIPFSAVTVLRDLRDSPTVTLMSPYKDAYYKYPLVRFCPQYWVNGSRIENLNLTKGAYIYALSLLQNVRLTESIENATKAENITKWKHELKTFMEANHIGNLREIFLKIAYDVDELFECHGCKSKAISLTIIGICYDFQFEVFQGTDIQDQATNFKFIYYPPFENFSEENNPNSIYTSPYASHVLYIDAHESDFFGFDPVFLVSNMSYTINLTPSITQRLPNMGTRKCLNEEDMKNKDKSYEMCISNCREWLYGWRCWGYMHFGLSYEMKGKQPLPWFSSLDEEPPPAELKKQDTCEGVYLGELMTCMNSCYSDCNQWVFDVLITESSNAWKLASPSNITRMTEAEFFLYYRRGAPIMKGYEGWNATMVSFIYIIRHGVPLIEEIRRKTASTALSSLGGMMGLVAGASVLSVFQLVQCIGNLCIRVKSCRNRDYHF